MEKPDASRAEFGEVTVHDCDGKLEACIEAIERGSWPVPYMMRAKLRLDMAFSCRTIHGHRLIVPRRGAGAAKTRHRAAGLLTGRMGSFNDTISRRRKSGHG